MKESSRQYVTEQLIKMANRAFYGLTDRDKKICRAAIEHIEALEAERAELEAIFELQRKRERPWIEAWRAEDPERELSLPDYGEMLQWLISRAEKAEAELTAARDVINAARVTRKWYIRDSPVPQVIRDLDKALLKYDYDATIATRESE